MYAKLNSGENFTELVFENKNKSYGAYAIRKSYHENVTISLAVTSTLFLLLAWCAFSFSNRNIVIPKFEIGNEPVLLPTKEYVFQIPEKKPEIETQKKETSPPSESGQMKVTDDPKDVTDKTNDKLIISNNPSSIGDSTVSEPSNNGPAASSNTGPAAPSKDVFGTKKGATKFPDVMPFMENMKQFIVKNLKFPREAVENNTTGAVVLTFIVEEDGSISNIDFLDKIGDGCEEEAKRVVESMPKWKPGTINNVPVRVQCNLPIIFKLK